MQARLASANNTKQALLDSAKETEQVEIARPVDQSWPHDGDRQPLLLKSFECQLFSFQFCAFIGIGRCERSIFGCGREPGDAMDASCADMNDPAQA